MQRKAYPSDVSDEEWALVAPHLTLMTEDSTQRTHSLREVFNDLPPWETVYRQARRWLRAGVFESLVHDLRELLRGATGRNARPSAAVFDSRALQSSLESGARAGYDGAKRRLGVLPRTGCASKWSSCRRRNAGSCSWPGKS